MTVTYIQPVFDCCVQHGEVCEEDTQVGHSALSIRLCKIKKICCYIHRGLYPHQSKRTHTQSWISEQLPAASFQTAVQG